MRLEGEERRFSERRSRERWRFNKDVSLADVISFVSAALAVVYAYTTLDKRVAVLEDFRIEQRDIQRQKDEENIRYQARIDAQLQALNEKMDKVYRIVK